MRFTLYLLWRAVLAAVIIIASPLWLPLGALVIVASAILESIVDWYSSVRRDFNRRQP